MTSVSDNKNGNGNVNAGAKSYALLVLIYLCFIGVASFYLTRDIPLDINIGLNRLFRSTIFSLRFSFHNLRDIATNILLYMPLGIFLAGYHHAGRSPERKTLVFGVLAGFLISVLVELVQAFIGRYSDIIDVISNGSGHAISYILFTFAVRKYKLNPLHLLGMNTSDGAGIAKSIAGVRFIYVAVVYIVSLLPFNISVRLNELIAQLIVISADDVPRIIVDPFYHFTTPQSTWHSLSSTLLMYLPLAAMSTWLSVSRGLNTWLWPLLHCFALACFIEFSKVFVLGARSDIAIILLAPVIGFLTSMLMSYSLRVNSNHLAKQQELLIVLILSLLAYVIFLALWSLSPFEFETSVNLLKEKAVNGSNFLPFRFHFTGRSIGAAIDIAREFMLYVPLGLLLSYLYYEMGGKKKAPILYVGIIVAVIAGCLELIQLLVIERYVDITDPILSVCGGLTGMVVGGLWNPGIKNERI